MLTCEFQYDLPEELIAKHPRPNRADSRLLVIDRESGEFTDCRFNEVTGFLAPNDALVFNDTRVIPARLFGRKDTGGKVEILVERKLDDGRALAHIRASKGPNPGTCIAIECRDAGTGHTIQVDGRRDDLFEISTRTGSLDTVLQQCGHMPLPPYIDRPDNEEDGERYQTVYASRPGAVAAPTAGLHFDEALLQRISAIGVERCHVTLHVGAGTFQPVRTDDIRDHVMHEEYLEVNEQAVTACRRAREAGGRIIAVGTTAVRSLETASASGTLEPFTGDTGIFIYPGYRFRSVDALLTNFHLPESTLIMLVSAFAGRELVMRAYRHAIEQRYRFFSYGDAMLIL